MKSLSRTVQNIIPDAVELRHTLHRFPEIALNEHNTRKQLQTFLGSGFIEKAPLIGTDLIVEIKGIDSSRITAFRADMDALPLNETSGRPWSSVNRGLAHSCGHDGHMAILAATARIIADSGRIPDHTLRFIFQPGEEVVAAGRELAAAGAYIGVESAYALHGWPSLPLGSVSVTDGIAFAASHNFNARFIGKGGHGAYPEKSVNPLLPAAESFIELGKLHEQLWENHGEVVSCGCIQGGNGTNVIPEQARIAGNVRFFNSPRGRILETAITRILNVQADKHNCSLELDYDTRYNQPLFNDPEHCSILRKTARAISVPVVSENNPERASEDFAFALREVPGCLFKLGLGETQSGLHSPDFDFPDQALATGISMMFSLAMGIH